MKLLELCTSDGFGGLELYAAKVADHYHRQGVSTLAVVQPGTLLDRRLAEQGVPRRHIRVRAQYLPLLAAWRLGRWIRQDGIHTLHLHARRDLPLAVFARIFSGPGLRIVYTRQMALTRHKRGFWHRFLYRHVNVYLTITRRLQADAQRFLPLPAERIRTLYYGVPKPKRPTPETCTRMREEFGLAPDRFTVAIFGRIEPGKGQHLLMAAIERLVGEGHAIQAAIIGHAMSEAYREELEQRVAQAGLADHIRFAGFHPQPTTIMGCFDAIVLATKDETFGLVLAEAQRAGVAVIGSNAGGVPEIIEDGKTGLLFESQNAQDLTRCLRRLMTEVGLRERLAKTGEAFADRQFTEEGHFERLTGYLEGKAD